MQQLLDKERTKIKRVIYGAEKQQRSNKGQYGRRNAHQALSKQTESRDSLQQPRRLCFNNIFFIHQPYVCVNADELVIN